MKGAYYNEIDPFAAEWLRNLIKAGEIADGDVDERDVRDVTPGELMGYGQCHFFAGIGGWSRALRLAGWGDDRAVWTGSCPCQSFSTAGRGKGFADERHLWPSWFHLIRECRPSTIFGEQVASKLALSWLDLVFDDLEAEGYTVGAADLCAASVGAPHIRQRLWFVGHAQSHEQRGISFPTMHREGVEIGGPGGDGVGLLAHALSPGISGRDQRGLGTGWVKVGEQEDGAGVADEPGDGREDVGSVEHAEGRRTVSAEQHQQGDGPEQAGEVGTLADTFSGNHRSEVKAADHGKPEADGPADRVGGWGGSLGIMANSESSESRKSQTGDGGKGVGRGSQENFWHPCEWLPCRDGKWRPTKPGLQPLASRIPGRVGQLRAAGNSIVPEVGAEFVKIFL